jgi:hypothetical protein
LRSTVASRKFIYFSVVKGPNFSTTIKKQETDLTVEMMTSCVRFLSLSARFRSSAPTASLDSVKLTNLSRYAFMLVGHSRGAWKDASFKKYNFAAAGVPTDGGALHPLLKVREEFRNIFFEMGCVFLPLTRLDLFHLSIQIHRDADEQVRRVSFLELRCDVRPSTTSGERDARYLLHQGFVSTPSPFFRERFVDHRLIRSTSSVSHHRPVDRWLSPF